MPVIKIQAGAEMDVLNKEELTSVLSDHATEYDKNLSRGIRFGKLSSSLNSAVNKGAEGIYTAGVYELGGPEPGYIWAIVNISYVGLHATLPANLLINGAQPSDLVFQGLINTGTIQIESGSFTILGGNKIVVGATGALTGNAAIVLYYKEVPIYDVGKL